MKIFSLLILLLSNAVFAWGQRISVQDYIRQYKDIAIAEMHRTGVPASIKLAQGILESESGNGNLVKRSNNHFGIKCKSYWTGEKVYHDDDERDECFRKYDHAEDSWRDHSDFLRNSERYAALFRLKKTDYKGWAHGLKKAGYATNPRYPNILIWQIEKYNLHQYDLMEYTPDESLLVENETKVPADLDAPVTSPTTSQSAEQVFDIGAKTKRNGLSAIYAVAGTSLLAIATKHNLSLSRLLEYNDLDADGLLEEDSWIYLERKHKFAAQESVVADANESYHSIAQSHGVQLEKLLEYNGVTEDDEVAAGTTVWLKPNTQAAVTTSGTIIHKVQPKEGLYAISRKYNVPVSVIREINQLTSDQLQVGQQLIISK
ncbi:MAG TPA: LysM peptidoglycan-binding domain-containing protein [Ferruginibacter sp.]|nr:LysM peptidoglycan-binding domain-containing protein [Ferruginibacter sp.]HRO06190.1 LysM peptidoglycan-binding domain-containing protein [Ferruginibacter sp.]HRO96583.1 LysM peptidoglycan-binding domain-containing protein [Ferruginibacter sp.]HRP49749.1 LysM peptidoglycan-binding domain-containing protein [Ferruginibacter sp.]